MKRLLCLTLLLCGVMPSAASAETKFVQTSRWSFSYSNDGLEGVVLRNVWYTGNSGVSAKVADWLALEFFRVRYQDDAAGPYSDNFQLGSRKLEISCPTSYDTPPLHLCSVGPGGCEVNPTAQGCNDSSAWVSPPDGVGVCQQSSSAGAVRVTAQGGANCGMYRFVETFELKDDGTIVLHLDAKGIQATNEDGTSREHMHYAYFRLDVDADSQMNVVSIDGATQQVESSHDLGGLQVPNSAGYVSPITFTFGATSTGKSVWVWAPNSDSRESPAYHGEATWLDWSRYDGWFHAYHNEEMVSSKRTKNSYGPPYGFCGADEVKNYDETVANMINREDILNDMAGTTLTTTPRGATVTAGAESLTSTDPVLWLNTPLYHDADPTSTTHGCHDVEVRLRPSWGAACYPGYGQPCTSGKTWQCDGTCQ